MRLTHQLTRSAPEALGISSAAILAFVDAADREIRDLHSLMLLRHGRVVAEGWWAPYGPAYPHSFYMLSAILQRLTGQTLLDYLQPRLFAPLGIERPTWESCPRGINVGGSGMSATTEDIARFGQLYLQQGHWEGQQLVPAAWIAEATSYQADNSSRTDPDWAQGYGYQFWRCRHGAYRGDGAFGQFCLVMPDQDAVLAITAGVQAIQPILDLVWQHLLPALGDRPLAEDAVTAGALGQRLAGLALAQPHGLSGSPTARQVSGVTYRFAANEAKLAAITFDFGVEGWGLRLQMDDGDHHVAGRYGAWQTGATTLTINARPPLIVDSAQSRPLAATGGWIDDATFGATLCFLETPFSLTVTSQFSEDQVVVAARVNVTYAPSQLPLLVGRHREPSPGSRQAQ